MGSSRTSGGIFRGHAYGNIPNHADIIIRNIEFEGPVKGEVYLYMTDQSPRHVEFDYLKGSSDIVVMVKVFETMAPILDVVARKFSTIRGMFFYLFKN
jgi:hypothetical protein